MKNILACLVLCTCFFYHPSNGQTFYSSKTKAHSLEMLSGQDERLTINLDFPCLFPDFVFFQDTSDTDPVNNSFVTPDPLTAPTNFRILFSADQNRWQITGSDTSIIFFYSEVLSSPNPPNDSIGEWKVGSVTALSGCGLEDELADSTFQIRGDGTQGEIILCEFKLVCPSANITLFLDENGTASINPKELLDSNSVLCDRQITLSQSSFSCSDIGLHSISITASDTLGNQDSCTVNIFIEDRIPPVAGCQSATVQLSQQGTGTLEASAINNDSNDACGITAMQLNQENFSCADIGEKTIILTVSDFSGNTDTCHAKVLVTDLLSPEALCKNISISLDETGRATVAAEALDGGSRDNCALNSFGLSLATFDQNNIGNNEVQLYVSDATGNRDSCTALVTVKDNLPPTVKCKTAYIYLNDAGQATLSPSDVDGGSFDASGDLLLELDQTVFDCFHVPRYNMVTLTATDKAGNQSSCMALVRVFDQTTLPAPFQTSAICQSRGTSYAQLCRQGIIVESKKTGLPFSGTQDWSQFTYVSLQGDFSLQVRVSQITDFAVAGVMFRSNLEDNALMAYAGISTYESGRLEIGRRSKSDQMSPEISSSSIQSAYFTLERQGNSIRILNGEKEILRQRWSAPSMLVGFFISAKGSWSVDAYFDRIQFNDTLAPYSFNQMEAQTPTRKLAPIPWTLMPRLDPDEQSIDVQIYPNPASEKLHINYVEEAGKELTGLSILDINGQKVFEQLFHPPNHFSGILSLESFKPGLYVLEIKSIKQKQYIRFIIQR